jgi:aryl-alcohol dehydrogenase-like predicted oxidoreductase
MRKRQFGRLGWQVGEIGYGMWGMGSWSGSNDNESIQSLAAAVELGCNFFDTAWVYGDGHSERLLGTLLRELPDRRLFVATKIPPKNMRWPARPEYDLDDTFPPDHIERYVTHSLENLAVERFDLIQLHVWDDRWLQDDRWIRTLEDLRAQGLFDGIGISLNTREPWNGIHAVRSGHIDSVQVVYNLFDQNPEDELFPACIENEVAVLARVPFDEGSLTGRLTADSCWPEGDWRNLYFNSENLPATLERVDHLRPLVPDDETMAGMALRFILANPAVSAVIPGMRKLAHVRANCAASTSGPLPAELIEQLRAHRWVRKEPPTAG